MKWWERREMESRKLLDSKSQLISSEDWWELWLRLPARRLTNHAIRVFVKCNDSDAYLEGGQTTF